MWLNRKKIVHHILIFEPGEHENDKRKSSGSRTETAVFRAGDVQDATDPRSTLRPMAAQGETLQEGWRAKRFTMDELWKIGQGLLRPKYHKTLCGDVCPSQPSDLG